MNLSVIPNDFNAYSVEFDGSVMAPPLLVSSLICLFLLTDLCFVSYASIEHIRLYLSHLSIVNSLKIPNNAIINIS